jgi:hypothetical protein
VLGKLSAKQDRPSQRGAQSRAVGMSISTGNHAVTSSTGLQPFQQERYTYRK